MREKEKEKPGNGSSFELTNSIEVELDGITEDGQMLDLDAVNATGLQPVSESFLYGFLDHILGSDN